MESCKVIAVHNQQPLISPYFAFVIIWLDDEYLNFLEYMQMWVQTDFPASGQSQMFMRVLSRYKLSSNVINMSYQGTVCLILM